MECVNKTVASQDTPKWIQGLITQYQNAPVGNPPQCCDQFSELFDVDSNFICAPDGGFTGAGDGKCSDFFQVRKSEKLIWQDQRTR
jgi:hypothetical protein